MKCLKVDVRCWCCQGRAECSWLLAGVTPACPHLQEWLWCFPGGHWGYRGHWGGRNGSRIRAVEAEPLQLLGYESCRLSLGVWGTKQSSGLCWEVIWSLPWPQGTEVQPRCKQTGWATWIHWGCPCLLQGGWTRGALKVPSNPNYSMKQLLCVLGVTFQFPWSSWAAFVTPWKEILHSKPGLELVVLFIIKLKQNLFCKPQRTLVCFWQVWSDSLFSLTTTNQYLLY